MTDPATTAPSSELPDWMKPFIVVLVLAGIMWAVQILDLLPRTNFIRYGIRPRQLLGLRGIVLGPFIHSGFGHLVSNTIPFVTLGWVIAAGGLRRYLEVTGIIAATSGLGVWLLSPSRSITIGASALVFGYLTYLIVRAVLEIRITYLLVGLLVLLVYGGILWGLIPRPGISWQGHLFGVLGGFAAASSLHRDRDVLPDPDDPLAPNLP